LLLLDAIKEVAAVMDFHHHHKDIHDLNKTSQ